TPLSLEQREYAETIKSSADALLVVVNDILDHSKLEAGRMELESLDFDLCTTLEDTSDLLAARAHAKGLEFAWLIDRTVPTFLRGDPGRLRQMITNLAGNAVKFTERGEVVLKVSLERQEGETAWLRFEVRDTGIGIPQERLGRLFDSFSQVDASTTRRYGGTGLGLTLCRQLVELMGGSIGVESREGHGSLFWFTLPLMKQSPKPSAAPCPPDELRECRILVVDDNATNRLVMRELLRAWGCRHDEAGGAAGALEVLRNAARAGDPFRIAILDLQMPDVDGESLGVAIKADPAISATSLIMLSSWGTRGDANRLRELGFSAFLTKPVRRSNLHDCLLLVAGAASGAAAPAHPIITRHTAAEARARKTRVLVAEDNITNQKVVQRLLEKRGYRVDTVANGKEAVQALALAPYDVVLMDVQMPEMDGLEATAAIRRREASAERHTPIVAMTAHAMKGDRERCLEAGMDDYVSKPVEPRELMSALGRVLHQEGPESPSLAPISTRPFAPVLDRAALLERLDGDEEFVGEVVEAFLEDAPPRVSRLRAALSDGDFTVIREEAHSIKGASANIEARALSQIALDLEIAGRDNALDRAIPLVEQLSQAMESFQRVAAEMAASSAEN
ncbi:MAG TPA: response regulator, partial [Armatimonadota bacterium]